MQAAQRQIWAVFHYGQIKEATGMSAIYPDRQDMEPAAYCEECWGEVYTKVRWKQVTTSRFDVEGFKKCNPRLYRKFCREIQSRRFQIT